MKLNLDQDGSLIHEDGSPFLMNGEPVTIGSNQPLEFAQLERELSAKLHEAAKDRFVDAEKDILPHLMKAHRRDENGVDTFEVAGESLDLDKALDIWAAVHPHHLKKEAPPVEQVGFKYGEDATAKSQHKQEPAPDFGFAYPSMAMGQ